VPYGVNAHVLFSYVVVLDADRGNLWSSSNGLPPDFVDGSGSASTTVPSSFELLLDELKRDSANEAEDTDALETTQRALCMLVARCIVFRGSSLIEELVQRNGARSSTVEILADILSETGRGAPDVRPDESQFGSDDQDIATVAGNAFLDLIGSSRYAQKKLGLSPNLLCTLPTAMVVPRLIAIANANMDSIDVVTVVTSTITQILVSSLPKGAEEFICVVVASLGRCDDEETVATDGNQNGSKKGISRSGRVCLKIAGPWRRTLLESPSCGTNGFAEILSAIGSAMFADPSSSVPLTLLGSVVGHDLSLLGNDDEALRVYSSVVALVQQCVDELDKAGGVIGKADESTSIYSRISPLLLLRRIPSGYYKVAWSNAVNGREEFELLLSTLANQLADRLGIPRRATNQSLISFSAEERQLTAEIAGLCLPFYDVASSSCCCYPRICYPSFLSALRTLKVIPDEQELLTPEESLRTARAALYTCCIHIPLAEDSEPGEGVFGTVSFVLAVLNVEVTEVEEDLVQMQTGCIDFIAMCLESTLQRHMKDQKMKSSPAIVEIKDSPTSLDASDTTSLQTSVSTKEALATSCSAIASSLRAGASLPCQLQLRNNCFGSESFGDVNQKLSTSARTCMWNAFLVVSQRCPDDDGRLSSWANLTAPWVLDWASQAPFDDNLHHPLCMAAAVQVIFILITRTKSFDCLGGGKTTSTSVLKAHRLAVTCIKTETTVGDMYARTTMRKAALKLLLALVTIDQMRDGDSISSCLSPGELGKTFTLLNGTANVDTDAEVRALAAHILSGMRPS